MPEGAEEIGRRVRRARLRLGVPRADLAAAPGKTQGRVSERERGLSELDRVGLLNLIASELHEPRRYDLVPVFGGTPRPAGRL